MLALHKDISKARLLGAAEIEEELEKEEEERAWCSYYLLFKYFTVIFFQ